MTFWSGQTLEERLTGLIEPATTDRIDCAAYSLGVGPEYYVTPTDKTSDPKMVSVKALEPAEAFAIPPGGFAYILTEEFVSVPQDALAFISIRARIKWRGLVNVSGFHVDPGFRGRLTFSVFNAGPVPVHLRRGDPTFLIWFASLDRSSAKYSRRDISSPSNIDLSILNQVAGEVHSVQGLAERIKTTENTLGARITSLERANGLIAAVAGILATIAVGLSVQWLVKTLPQRPEAKPAASAIAAPTPLTAEPAS